jgi:5-methyltetrahydrofolate--homocysteine methyltransferase
MSHPLKLAGLEPLNIDDDSLFVNVGERTNVPASGFRQLVLAGDSLAPSHAGRFKAARK